MSSSSYYYYSNLPGVRNPVIVQSVVYNYLKPLRNYLNICLQKEKANPNKLRYEMLKDQQVREIYEFFFFKESKERNPNQDWDEIYENMKNHEHADANLDEIEAKMKNYINQKMNADKQDNRVWITIVEEARTRKEQQKEDKLFSEIFRKRQVFDCDHDGSIIQITLKAKDFNALQLQKKPMLDKVYIYFEPDVNQLNQQIKAIDVILERPQRFQAPLVRLFENLEHTRWENFQRERITKWHVLDKDYVEGVDEQREFVEKSLATADFAFLEGPPGSGKTTTICEITIQESLENHKTMLVASTHVAVDNVLEKIGKNRNIIAIRIGDENDCSEKTVDYLLDNFRWRIKSKIQDKMQGLKEKNKLTVAQKLFLEHLNASADESRHFLNDVLMLSANLICGTTIGILQHPQIREQKAMNFSNPFDLLILDEASKTTLQEFLVPALFARKWILSGDVKQLSPYIEEDYVNANIESLIIKSDVRAQDGIITELDSKILLNCFIAFKYHRKILVMSKMQYMLDAYAIQLNYLGIPFIDLRNSPSPDTSIEKKKFFPRVLASSIFIGTETDYNTWFEYLPPDMDFIDNDARIPDFYSYRRNYWKIKEVSDYEEEEFSWSNQVSWRLIRKKEMRSEKTKDVWDMYNEDINRLLPAWISRANPNNNDKEKEILREENNETSKKILEKLQLIEKLVLPSVLEILLKGTSWMVGQDASRDEFNSVLTAGFSENIRKDRFTSLEYQHRMHYEIACFPEEYIYDKKNLRSGKTFPKDWDCNLYGGKRQVWIHVDGRKDFEVNKNVAEINVIMKELKAILDWFMNHPKPNYVKNITDEEEKLWKIAVLSFYKPQVEALRKELQKFFRSKKYRLFYARKWNAKVELCTVDKFQGQEADVVFLSFVQTQTVGFLDCINRLNVSITRARFQNVFVGDRNFFLNKKRRKNRSLILEKLAEKAFLVRSIG